MTARSGPQYVTGILIQPFWHISMVLAGVAKIVIWLVALGLVVTVMTLWMVEDKANTLLRRGSYGTLRALSGRWKFWRERAS